MAAKDLSAESHKKRALKRATFKALRKNVKASYQEREIEEEHESRKNAIDDFFGNLKVKAREEEERLKRDKLDKLQKDQIKTQLV